MDVKFDKSQEVIPPETNVIDINVDDLNDVKEKEKCLSSEYTRLPKSVYFIIITELCERFTYYGMRSILILYLTQHLLLQEGNAVAIYHFFICLCYFTTIIGSFVSDNYLGKYKTLVITGTIYTAGATFMSLTAIPARNLIGPLISLILIGFGTGGVKACVAPFGGDQIPADDKIALSSYFSVFYFGINIGALLSTIVTPILRANVACNGSMDCYPLAFGVPALLMAVALVIFLAGRPWYNHTPVSNNIYIKAVCCIILAIKTWYRERHIHPKKQLLDYASHKYDESFIDDLRTLFRIVILFLPLPVYWALYEQMGSRWTLQATQLDGEIFNNFFILPDQMFIFNVLFVVILIVIFDSCIFPLTFRISPTIRPLKRITVGIMFTFLAFVATFILQRHMESLQPPKITSLVSRVVLTNGQSCEATLTASDGRILQAAHYQTSSQYLDLVAGSQLIQVNIPKCSEITAAALFNGSVVLFPGQMNFLIITVDSTNNVVIRVIHDSHAPNIKGYPLIKLTVSFNSFDKYQFLLKHSITDNIERQFLVVSGQLPYISDWNILSKPGRYIWSVKSPSDPNTNISTPWTDVMVSLGNTQQVSPIRIASSEVCLFYMTFSGPRNLVVVIPLSINNGSRLSVLWQLPQYVLISIGEVLVNVPGLTFSYDQAPMGMKSLVNALWYMCDALGNAIVVIVAKLHLFERQSIEYLTFAIICVVFNVIFAGLAYWYPMVQQEQYKQIT